MFALAGCDAASSGRGDALNTNHHDGLSSASSAHEPVQSEQASAQTGAPVGQAGAAGSEPGDVALVAGMGPAIAPTQDAGVSDAMPPSTQRVPLRSAAVGEAPVFDPGAVYLLGYTREFNVGDGDGSGLSIAPVDDPTDSVGGFGYFTDAMIRRTDGRLIYQDNSGQDYATEFLRDAALLEPHPNSEGETVHASSLPCDPTETEPPMGYPRSYLLSYDDVLYHTCAVHDDDYAIGDDTRVWYSAEGELVYDGGAWLERIGAQKRALAYDENDLVVLDLESGTQVGSVQLDGLEVVSVRSLADGFTLALHREGEPGRYWLDIDLDGATIARGSYAPLPPNTRYVPYGTNAWAIRTGAIDAQGRLYEFAGTLQDGSVVVVRRPREGASEIVYTDAHASEDETLLHLGPVLLITGG